MTHMTMKFHENHHLLIPFPRPLGSWKHSPSLSLAADVLLQFLIELQQTLGAQRFRNTVDDPRVIRGAHLANPRSRTVITA